MIDIQRLPDKRGINIQTVGVKKLHLPLLIYCPDGTHQSVLGNICLSVDLPHHFKGTHMSRFVEILVKWSKKKISGLEIHDILTETINKLEAKGAQVEIRFKYFIKKKAPISRQESFLDYNCEFSGILRDNEYRFVLGVEVPVTALCPCSREIADYGAHNQRGHILARVECRPGEFIWIEELVELLEYQGSCAIFPLLKREDEKYVTEKAYNNPKFVEDILRDVVVLLRKDKRIVRFEVEVESYESIHNHSAFAYQIEDREVIGGR